MPAPRPPEYMLSIQHQPKTKSRKPPTPPVPRWIDLNIISSWIRACDENHGDHCQRARLPHESQGLPRWLIHVSEKRIVPFHNQYRYVALSYVWGRSTGHDVQLLLDNLELFQQDESLEDIWEQIPATVRHAIELVRLVGQDYLWVDRLCIVQDDHVTKQEQISQMAFIYGNAYFTLVAAAAYSAEEGLKGIKHVSPPIYQNVWPERANMDHYGLVAWSPWNERGWTLQELVFSQRSLFFHKNELTWECHCAIWHERMQLADIGETNCLGTSSPNARGFRYSPWPDLQEFHQLATSYSRRKLTFPSDILSAFSGITTALSHSFPGGFLFGLPEVAFDVGLLWRSSGPASMSTSLGESSVPTWSWMIGLDQNIGVDLSPWASGFAYLAEFFSGQDSGQDQKQNYSPLHVAYQQEWNSRWSRKRPPEGVLDGLITQSICSWYVREGTTDRHISNNLEEYKHCSLDLQSKLPPGWQRHEGIFRHSVDPERRFKYPIPLVTDEEEVYMENGYWFLIATRAERAFFHNIPESYGQAVDRLEGEAVVKLCDTEQTWVGCLRVQTRTILWRLLSKKVKCELVAISQGYMNSNAHGWPRLDEHEALKNQGLDKFEFYNVLLIEWKDGIAYRQGIGRVDKSAWEAESREQIDLVLG
ncbi:heterokaryon incompatibility [Fusarium longipes]|uniref:Heterokaryon incompatibility n=1 Tax=Fusarium longipes TaxID=694270 RepID=A0A395T3J8_9HYPO|nr:heterokaryon incompatibility [Fusarium longipes]